MKHYNVVEVNIILSENKRHRRKQLLGKMVHGRLSADYNISNANAITIDILVQAIHFIECKCLHLVSSTRAIV